VDEDLFGAGPAPRLEIPQEPSWPQAPPPPSPLAPTVAFPSPPPEFVPPPPPLPGSIFAPPPGEATLTYVPPEERTMPDAGLRASNVADQGGPAAVGQEPSPTEVDTVVPAGESPGFVAPRVPRPQRKDNSGWIMAIIIVPLVSYSVAITVLFLMLYLQKPKEYNPFDVIPDVNNQNPPAGKKPGHTEVDWKRIPLQPLPDKMKVGLKETIWVGDLAVKPLKVELRKVTIFTKGYTKGELGDDDSLVLYLELKNVSDDTYFCPLDPNFGRPWTQSFESNMPFTYLELGGRRYYGGLAKLKREFLEIAGTEEDPDKKLPQQVEKELKPGEAMLTFVCTDTRHHIGQVLAGYDGPLLYRVQLRRGLVNYKGQEHSATCVVGVTFTAKDVKRMTSTEPKEG
jgi:hypothetical protein